MWPMHARPATATFRSIASRRKLRGPDWAISDLMLARATDAILRRDLQISNAYDVPYLAGYSEDGKTIYIDMDLPRTFQDRRGRKVDVFRYLFLHETIEKTLLQAFDLKYQHAHQIALRVEAAAVRADGVMWKEYDDFMKKQIKVADEDQELTLPPDLDLTPYEDEHDVAMLKRMRAAQPKLKRRSRRH